MANLQKGTTNVAPSNTEQTHCSRLFQLHMHAHMHG